jgi:H+/Cl- antiporter ClcA
VATNNAPPALGGAEYLRLVGLGAVLGPEAPLIALASVVGVAVTLFVRVHPRGDAVLGSAGSFAAISALFGGPIVAGMMMVEGGLEMGAMLLPSSPGSSPRRSAT